MSTQRLEQLARTRHPELAEGLIDAGGIDVWAKWGTPTPAQTRAMCKNPKARKNLAANPAITDVWQHVDTTRLTSTDWLHICAAHGWSDEIVTQAGRSGKIRDRWMKHWLQHLCTPVTGTQTETLLKTDHTWLAEHLDPETSNADVWMLAQILNVIDEQRAVETRREEYANNIRRAGNHTPTNRLWGIWANLYSDRLVDWTEAATGETKETLREAGATTWASLTHPKLLSFETRDDLRTIAHRLYHPEDGVGTRGDYTWRLNDHGLLIALENWNDQQLDVLRDDMGYWDVTLQRGTLTESLIAHKTAARKGYMLDEEPGSRGYQPGWHDNSYGPEVDPDQLILKTLRKEHPVIHALRINALVEIGKTRGWGSEQWNRAVSLYIAGLDGHSVAEWADLAELEL